MAKSQVSKVKKRHWCFILYPESAPTNWREILQQTGLQCAVSPLHDKDVNPNGEIKKAHYHVILTYSGPTTYNSVKALTETLSQPIPQPLEQIRGYYRYFTHKDNPEKYQYDEVDISSINGFCITDFVELTASEVTKIKRDIQQFIIDNNIIEYSILMDFLLTCNENNWYEVACNNTYFFERYISSKRNMQKR